MAVIEKENSYTTNILRRLLAQSLIKQPARHRYSIHLLIKQFLVKQQENENERMAERAKDQAMRAELLMVKYYLKLGHDLTIKSYSKDKYKESREALKKEAHNIQNVLKICCDQEDPTTSDIPDCLAQSKIYTTSARFFSLFVRTIIPGCIVNEFLQRCADMAKEKQQHAIKINFDCLLADQERIRSIGRPDEILTTKMEEIKEEFTAHYEDLRQDHSLCAHYYYQYGRYLSRKSEKKEENTRLDLQICAREQLENSLRLRNMLATTSVGIADVVYSLLKLGNICKMIAASQYHFENTPEFKKLFEEAVKHCSEAIELSQNNLGEHELTSSCYKYLGDVFLKGRKPSDAESKYKDAKKIRENLGLNVNERHVNLLNNLGRCLTVNRRTDEAVEVLEGACDMAVKIGEINDANVSRIKVYVSLAIAYDSAKNYVKAVEYANKALKFEETKLIARWNDLDKLYELVSNNVETNAFVLDTNA
jgi:tetratricopeptide (TPR) repeat protein